VYTPGVLKVKVYTEPLPVRMALLVKLGAPVDSTLCGTAPVELQVHRTRVPAVIVTPVGAKKLFPTLTSTVGGGGGFPVAVNPTGEPVRPATWPWAPWAPTVAPSVQTVVAPDVSVIELVGEVAPPPLVTTQPTVTPATPLPN
jgi:hypothetical protein